MGFFVGHWLETHIIKMKVFAIACLIVGAFAEPEAKPEAEADAYYYGNNGYGAVGSLGYAARPLVSSVGYAARPAVSSYSSYGLRSLGKRSADAEPEAEAEADAYYYGNNYGYGTVGSLGYAARPLVSSVGYAAHPAVSSYNYASRPILNSYGGYANSPYVNSYGSYGLRSLGKRSADAEPEAEAEADAY